MSSFLRKSLKIGNWFLNWYWRKFWDLLFKNACWNLVTTSNIRNLLFCLLFLTHILDQFFRNAFQKNREKSIISRYAMAIFAIVIIVFDTNYRKGEATRHDLYINVLCASVPLDPNFVNLCQNRGVVYNLQLFSISRIMFIFRINN